jgi:tungstate transport system substrate-binding protein
MPKSRTLVAVLAAALLTAVLAACGPDPAPTRLRLATTTSTENSGLLAWLLPPFEQRENIEVQIVAVGSGAALKLGERGDADIVLVHARGREDAFLAAGHASERRDVMWNDFLVLGPADDPAGIAGSDPAAAFARLFEQGAAFVSRGDDSGTHTRERSFWTDAGVDPRDSAGYVEAGQGMGACLVIADERGAYVLADRGTWLAFKERLDLVPLVQRHRSLRNPYGVLPVDPTKSEAIEADSARKLADYLTSPEGQERIAAFRRGGEVLFHPASDAEADD